VQKNQGNSVILVFGGVQSGKSRYAQQLTEHSSQVTFVATAERRDGSNEAGLEACVEDLCAALKTTSRKVILVSNEVGSGVVPAYALSRRFRDVVGEINQRVANVADTVLLMVAGLPLILKGSLEGGHR
jgi:adenosyl cobinamide kinase/adenosyl cobinamide phosphate guanylyltransferase